jgi:hypothetical protein
LLQAVIRIKTKNVDIKKISFFIIVVFLLFDYYRDSGLKCGYGKFLFTSIPEPRVSTDLTDFTEMIFAETAKIISVFSAESAKIRGSYNNGADLLHQNENTFYSTKNLKSITA